MKKAFRTFKAVFWYFVVMWLGIGYFLYSPLTDWMWYVGMGIVAFAAWELISRVRQIIKF